MTKEISNTVRFALIGAAGAIGNSIGAAIRSQGHNYRVVGRNRAQLEKCFGADPLAESVTWNPDDPASVRTACRGVEPWARTSSRWWVTAALSSPSLRRCLDPRPDSKVVGT